MSGYRTLGEALDPHLFRLAAFLSRPPGFYLMIVIMAVCTALIPFELTELVSYGLSVAAILIAGVVLIPGYRDTAAIHAKLDEIVLSLDQARKVGLEHADAKQIRETLKR